METRVDIILKFWGRLSRVRRKIDPIIKHAVSLYEHIFLQKKVSFSFPDYWSVFESWDLKTIYLHPTRFFFEYLRFSYKLEFSHVINDTRRILFLIVWTELIRMSMSICILNHYILLIRILFSIAFSVSRGRIY